MFLAVVVVAACVGFGVCRMPYRGLDIDLIEAYKRAQLSRQRFEKSTSSSGQLIIPLTVVDEDKEKKGQADKKKDAPEQRMAIRSWYLGR
ncbi:hypothetical protein BV898_01425 [Hypsibius exemplaris]|uniref:Secreted protein n=1 Tax=Hypsibius exemplaris TaxID=2072580 RepID=A0A1W0XBF1_HYPEX|nr:hypothetical protein BV898_01425 [Hypsibius exemplaris]